MAIDLGTETETVTKTERTFRVVIDIPKDQDPSISIERELVRTASDGSVVSIERCALVNRRGSEIAPTSYTFNGKTITGADLAGFVALVADTCRQADISAAETPPG